LLDLCVWIHLAKSFDSAYSRVNGTRVLFASWRWSIEDRDKLWILWEEGVRRCDFVVAPRAFVPWDCASSLTFRLRSIQRNLNWLVSYEHIHAYHLDLCVEDFFKNHLSL
jgi:hypothetical protein